MDSAGNKFMFATSFRLFIALVILFALSLVAVQAQENDIESHLLKSIGQTRQQLEAERQRIKLEGESQEKDLNEATIHQERLVD